MRAFTARELAQLELPELPTTESAMIRRAKSEEWTGRKRAGRGGGVEYQTAALLKKLPPAARDALLNHATKLAPSAAPSQPALPVPANNVAPAALDTSIIAEWRRACADARAAILQELDTLASLVGGIDRATKRMIQLADAGGLRVELAELVPTANARAGQDGSRSLSRATLYRWRADFARDGWRGLIPQEASRVAEVPAWGMPLLTLYRVPTKRSLAAIMEELAKHLPAGVPMPSYGQARSLLKQMAPAERERGRLGPNALLQLKGFKRRSTEHLLPLEVVTADGHTFKADVAHPIHGREFRPEVCAILDTATRYCFGHSAGLSESAHVVMDAIRVAVTALGYFSIFYSDNGRGFTGKVVTHETLGLFARLGVTDKQSIPGRAQARGKIERVQPSLWGRAARKMITYNGRDMDNEARRKVVKLVEADFRQSGMSPRLMPWPVFLEFCKAEVTAYNNRPHRGLPKIRDEITGALRHMSPAEALAQHRANGWEPRPVPADILNDLFRPHVERTVARGEVRLPWARYFDQRLVEFHGQKVMVAYDHVDSSRVWVRTLPDERLICIADRDGNVILEQPQSAVDHANRKSLAASLKIIDRRRELKIAERQDIGIIDHAAPSPMSEEAAEIQAELVAEFEQHGTIMNGPGAVRHDAPADEPEERTRFRRALSVHQALGAGAPVSDTDRVWFVRYQTGSEWRTQLGLYEDFGEAMFA